MNYLKKVGVSLLISFIPMLLSIFLFTLLEYVGWISNNTFKIFVVIFSLFSFLISGILFGKKMNKKGWLEGIKLSIIEILIIVLANFLFSTTSIKNLIMYAVIFLGTTIGSIIGVNKSNSARS